MSETEEQRSVSEQEEKEERKDSASRASNQGDGGKTNEEKESKEKESKEKENKDDKEKEMEKEEEDKKQKEYFRNELKRLQTSLQRESSKIKAPPVKPHFPYVFTNLAPYYNTYTASYLIESAEEVPISRGYMMRKTAIGLCDPWEDLRMDREMLPRIERRLPRPLDKKKQAQKNREKGEGSTRLPKFPAVELDTRDLSTRKLNYDDVRMLRNKLREKYSANAGVKVDEDYKRTKQDYHRMELDRLDQVHPSNRSHMKSAYFAYLRNTPGSKRAINECVKKTEEELEEEEKERQRKENEQQQQQTVEATS
ncbi:myb-like protein X isoform X2 [Lineus longissimus]|uniref:myb-like protein X isoform X2 n=1 Tax=Lineus longissimus TaxID=88925 RepID=UPI002B4CA241